MTRDQYRRRWLLYHGRYERRAFTIFRKALQSATSLIPFEEMSELTYPTVIQMNVGAEAIEQGYEETYVQIGSVHGKRVGAEINKQLKRFEIGFFDIQFRRQVRQWLIDNVSTRIVSVRQELIKYLITYIADRIEEGETMSEIVTALKKHIATRGFYRWQIERIVRTETTAAANLGAMTAGDVSGVLMVKEWVSSADGRTRRHEKGDLYDHWDMDGVRVGKEEDFSVPNILTGIPDNIGFPGDPKGQAANVINCRCTAGLIPQRDLNGDIVFT